MSIKSAIEHIHDEVSKVEAHAKLTPTEIYLWALKGMEAEIGQLGLRLNDMIHAETPEPDAPLPTDGQPQTQNRVVTGIGLPQNVDTTAQAGDVPEAPEGEAVRV